MQRLCDRLPKREQHPDRRQVTGEPWPRDALDPHRPLLREQEAVQPGPGRLAREPGDRARTDDVPALRERAVRNGLPRERYHPQRGWTQRHGLQPLHRHPILRKQLPVQGAPLQLFRLQPATSRQEENRRTCARWQFSRYANPARFVYNRLRASLSYRSDYFWRYQGSRKPRLENEKAGP